MANHPSMSYAQSGAPQPAAHGPFLDQEYLPSFWTMGSIPEGTDLRLGQSPQESSYYSTYGSASSKPRAQDLLPQYVTYSEGQSWTAPHDPWVMGSLPEVADPRLVRQTAQELLPYDTSGSTICEPGAQEFLPRHSTYSEEQNLSGAPQTVNTLKSCCPTALPDSLAMNAKHNLSMPHTPRDRPGRYSPILSATETLPEEADPHLGQSSKDPSSYGTESTSYVPGAHDILRQHSSYSEEQTWLGSSSRRDQSLTPPMAQDRQNRVMCTQPGCGMFLKKENLTRHINEVHERKIKARCDYCGREFTRTYLKKEHMERWQWNVSVLSLRGHHSDALTIWKPLLRVSLARQQTLGN
ncbi:hypothetical protein F4604DRAFT_1901209 [Suillus subluteus]|nr:hypothetical protein F4604DRAFT_1901209 [Suillus subluteus]